jgi:hypothetical protein
MTKEKSEEKTVHVHTQAMIDSDDPRTNVMALVNVAKSICEALGKTPAEGAVMLMTAGASILDHGAQSKAEGNGNEYDPAEVIPAYMQMAAHGWNLNAMMFRGVTAPELGEVSAVDDGRTTLQ